MSNLVKEVSESFKKKQVVDVHSGDTVRVHQKIKEGEKERVQIFEGLVIRTDRKDSQTSTITVRKISSGVGVEKSFLMHSPLVTKVEVIKRSKVRRKYLSYMRELTGKSARLAGVNFDKSINDIRDEEAEAEEAKLKSEKEEAHKAVEDKKAKEQEAIDKKVAAATADRDQK